MSPTPARYTEIQRLVQRLGLESQRVGHVFAHRHGLHPTDLDALVRIMDADLAGAPLTPGRLAEALTLSSGATTALIDRLVAAGHVARDRDPDDRRKTLLRHSDAGRAVAFSFFGPLGRVSAQVMSEFTDDDLELVQRFLAGMVAAIAAHEREV